MTRSYLLCFGKSGLRLKVRDVIVQLHDFNAIVHL